MFRRIALALCAILVSGSLFAIAEKAEATVGTTFTLGPHYTRSVYAGGKLFVLGAPSDPILVRNADGSADTTIPETDATDIVASSDGGRLYVAMDTSNAIVAIDTSSLTTVATYSTGADTCPQALSALGTVVWFGYGCTDAAGNHHIGAINLGVNPYAVVLGIAEGYYNIPMLASSPAAPNRLFAGTPGLTPESVQSYAISGLTLTQNASVGGGSFLADLAITADGASLITASGSPYDQPSYSTANLTPGVVYATSSYPDAVATSAAADVAAGITSPYGTDIYMFSQSGTLLRSFDFGSTSELLAARGLTFNSDGSVLYAVSVLDGSSSVTLHVIADPAAALSTLTLTGPTADNRNSAITLTGTLSSGGTPLVGKSVAISDTNIDGTKSLGTVETDAGGHYSLTTSPNIGGSNVYTATSAGDTAHASASASFAVAVSRISAGLTLTLNHSTYSYKSPIYVTAHLGASYKNHSITIKVTPYAKTAVTKTATVDSHGNVTMLFYGFVNTTVSASYYGDEIYAPRTLTMTAKIAAYVPSSLSGYYGTSGSYHLYHWSSSAFAILTAHMYPDVFVPSRHVYFTAQVYKSGKWVAAVPKLEEFVSGGAAQAGFHGSRGYNYRLQVLFYGDVANGAYNSTIWYVQFTS